MERSAHIWRHDWLHNCQVGSTTRARAFARLSLRGHHPIWSMVTAQFFEFSQSCQRTRNTVTVCCPLKRWLGPSTTKWVQATETMCEQHAHTHRFTIGDDASFFPLFSLFIRLSLSFEFNSININIETKKYRRFVCAGVVRRHVACKFDFNRSRVWSSRTHALFNSNNLFSRKLIFLLFWLIYFWWLIKSGEFSVWLRLEPLFLYLSLWRVGT